MSETWKGPWRCPTCEHEYSSYSAAQRHGMCTTGSHKIRDIVKLIPYDRRATPGTQESALRESNVEPAIAAAIPPSTAQAPGEKP